MNNAELFVKTFGIYATEMWSMPEKSFLKWLNAPAEEPVKTGEWIYKEYTRKIKAWTCSECGKPYRGNYSLSGEPAEYCQRCGAKNVKRKK